MGICTTTALVGWEEGGSDLNLDFCLLLVAYLVRQKVSGVKYFHCSRNDN